MTGTDQYTGKDQYKENPDAADIVPDEPIYAPGALFHAGMLFDAWKYFGVHGGRTEEGTYRYIFRVWAPDAAAISVVGDLSDWESGLPMSRGADGEIWELSLEGDADLEGSYYKYAVTGRDGVTWLKADPYAVCSETLQNTASILRVDNKFMWQDGEWMKKRRNTVCPKPRGFKPKFSHFYSAPLNIYEMHLGSWRMPEEGAEDGKYLNYRAIADLLAPYLSDMGYTHVELLPVMEHPYDGSLGYQICGYYAPTSRYGTPEDFRYFINRMHASGIGVILDWVPACFPKDRHGLFEFDGQPLYEYQDPQRREYRKTGTCFFDLGRPEVQSFLISNALYWLGEFHADGLRVNAVSSMLYLDYDRNPGEWEPGPDGSHINRDAVAFLQKLNNAVHEVCPDALMIAGEAADWPGITKPTAEGGLGFSFRWDLQCAQNLFSYTGCDPAGRKNVHHLLTELPVSAFLENQILPVSHSEVSGGKKSLVDKMFGEYDDKFCGMRTVQLYLMTMPGKKLTFMGCEFAQFREWEYTNQLEWFMIEYPRHIEMQRFFRALNHLYLENPSLWEIDDTDDGFAWIDAETAERNILSYRRRDKKGHELIVILNFSPSVQEYTLYVPKMGRYEEILTTDRYEFGGKNRMNEDAVRSFAVTDETGRRKNHVSVTLPALGGVVLKKQLN